MARPQKDSKSLNVKLDRTICERFEAYCEEVGQTKTKALERILEKYLEQQDEQEQ